MYIHKHTHTHTHECKLTHRVNRIEPGTLMTQPPSVNQRNVLCRVWLLAAQKPINRSSLWKGKFALFQMPAIRRGRVADICPKADSPSPDRVGVAWGATCRNSSQLWQSFSNWSSVV